MARFELWFTHKGIYQLPDGTRVVAYWTTVGDDPRWWFVAEQSQTPGRLGEMIAVVYPNGSIYNYAPEMDGAYPAAYIPHPSDLCIEDIRPVAHEYWQSSA